jgi:hypothetical protein
VAPHGVRLGALVAALALVTGAARADSGGLEYAVKATYLYKFAPFVEWPPSAFASTASSFNICILGADPFGGTLDSAVSGQRIDAHPVTVTRVQKVDASSRCHILYLGASRAQSPQEALGVVRGKPVLTVSEQTGAGAVILFVVQDNRVRFDIDTNAAAANGVTLSSRLLALANSIKAGS